MKMRKSSLFLAMVVCLLMVVIASGSTQAATGDPVLLNEVLASHTGTDNTEFVELYGTPGTNLSGLSVIVVEGDAFGPGSIDRRFDFKAFHSIGSNGFFLIGNCAGLPANYQVTPDASISSNYFENSSLTVALVETSSLSGDAVTGSEIVLDTVALTDGDDGDTFYFDAPVVGPDGSFFPAGAGRVTDGVDTDTVSDWFISDFFLGSDNTPTAGGLDGCAPLELTIPEIQGSGPSSIYDGEIVTTSGLVTLLSGEGADLWIQDPDGDGNPATSDGIFVFDAVGDLEVNVGDVVRVTGTVDEFFDLTEITDVSSVTIEGSDSPAPTPVTLPVTSIDDLEAYEGMLITFPQELYISEFFNFDRFNEIVLTTGRQFQPTAVFEPGSPQAAALGESNDLSRITLDDNRSTQNPDPARHPNGSPFTLDNRFRGGDIVRNVTGVLDYSFGLYRIQPTEGADYTAVNFRPHEPEEVGGNITVAAFNVLNYFTTIDNGQDNCGPDANLECRGADNLNELERQRDKIVAALAAMDADVVGLIEIENDAGASTADLVEALNDSLGAEIYDYIETGFIGTDAIKQAFIYKMTTVTPVGDFAVLDSDAFVDPNNLGDPKNRPALAQTFMDNEFGDRFTAVVNHFKSKGSPCGPGDDDPQQGNCNLTRTLAAQELADWLATDPTGTGASDVLIIGDLNSYDKEDPIDVLKANGYADLVFEYGGEFAYSFVFDGQLGYLDYAMANQAALSRITGTTVWHNNTDEPDILDYDTTFKQDAQDDLYEPNAFRSSDHDPVIVGICERPDVVLTPDVLWPANHMYVDVTATVFVDGQAANGNATFVSVTSNEPDNGEDDGDTINDIVQIDDFTFQLRAERSGVGSGRVYTVTYEVLDACDGVQTVSGTVTVPLSLEGGGGRQNNPNR